MGEPIPLKTARRGEGTGRSPRGASRALSQGERREKENGFLSLGKATEERTAQLKAAKSPAQFLWWEARKGTQGLGRLLRDSRIRETTWESERERGGGRKSKSLEREPRGACPGPLGPLQLGLQGGGRGAL